jgi:hypothetical protein
MIPNASVTGFYVAPNVIMTVNHITANPEFSNLLFYTKVYANCMFFALMCEIELTTTQGTWTSLSLARTRGSSLPFPLIRRLILLCGIEQASDVFLTLSTRRITIPNAYEQIEDDPAHFIQIVRRD